MSKDKFIEFCVEYLPYKECVERYMGDEVKAMAGLFLICLVLFVVAYVVLAVNR